MPEVATHAGARARVARAFARSIHFRGSERLVRLLLPPNHPSAARIRTITTARDGSRFEVDLSSYIEWRLYLFGEYEPRVRQVVQSVLGRGDAAIDIGANVGVHSITMARAVGPSGTVLAVEPVERLARRLERNVSLNRLDNVPVAVCAASSRSGTASFFAPRATAWNQGQGSLLRLGYLDPNPVDVRLARLDELASAHGLERVRLIKIDVEGSEAEVLAGAVGTIARWQPYVLFEYAPEQYGADDGLWWASLSAPLTQDRGYAIWELGRRGRPTAISERPSRSGMVLAVPPQGAAPW